LSTIRKDALERLKACSRKLPVPRFQRVFVQGDPAGEIVRYASHNDVDLIVMGTHGCGRMRELLLGSVAAKVMHDAHCPVWTQSLAQRRADSFDDRPYTPGHILCALELVPEAEQLLRYETVRGQALRVPVSVVHCIPTAHLWPGGHMSDMMREYLLDTAGDEVARLQHRAGSDLPVVLGDKGVGRSVAESVGREAAGLVLIGRGKAQEPFGRIRTHGFEILRDAPCPVLSCPLKAGAASAPGIGMSPDAAATSARAT
jgi:hypothetical protein